MDRLRRTEYAFLYCADSGLLDLARLVRGTIEIRPHQELFGVSLLTGDERPVDAEDVALLLRVPGERWLPLAEIAPVGDATRDRALSLARAGFLVTDEPAGPLARLRERDERLNANGWDPHAALFHLAVRRFGSEAAPSAEGERADAGDAAIVAEALERLAAEGRAPSPHFHSRGGTRLDLPASGGNDGLFATLARRRTTRGFDPEAAVTVEQLAALLGHVFGCRGVLPLGSHLTLVRKTSPSGGALHPVEAYPLVIRASDAPAGLYRYDVERHALEELEPLAEEAARELAARFTRGQADWRGASALVVLTARFYRSFWKYRRDPRAYAVLLLDAGHLSQTFQLVCAELGIGGFVTASIDGDAIDERLGLEPTEEGALAICGCGVPKTGSALEMPFEPYSPPR